MLPTSWLPLNSLWKEIDRMQGEMNRLYERFADGSGTHWDGGTGNPALNVWEDEHNFYVEAELPGLSLDQLEIYVTPGNQLTLQGERRPVEVKDAVWHRQERGFGKFSRSVTLPLPVNADRVEATFEHGVLRVTLPKSEAARPRRIAVKAE